MMCKGSGMYNYTGLQAISRASERKPFDGYFAVAKVANFDV